ncbi:hypothetical protein GCK72_024866 [Caenorhabditis remanei]|uniref:Uncharacterized protein n=1 Tax=Caenorhabditis remanei TaxID=31234 RepID=A0A2P4WP69_CAERE|nr:hypothetical protein GCK72_024866 [Caenorhabditis remanei]KAF1748399.1 hypothetical protein GCK72_024866 [Caenorhabditis remanei]
MEARNSNVLIEGPEPVVGFFVPASSAAYVTEILELALSTIPGARVCAGTLSKVMDSNLPATNAHPDSDFLPDLDTSDGSCPETDVEPEGTKRKHGDHHKCVPGKTGNCCMHRMANEMKQKYGTPVAQPNGTASCPRIMVQYPGLPYVVPVHEEFNNLGLPRGIVRFGCNGVFMVSLKTHISFLG